ncbi:ligase-associated DNA damage response endonuclease PdeM [soil metagenome]
MILPFELCSERLELRADRTLYWPSLKTLLLADPHFGKAETFRAASVPVPGDAMLSLAKLSRALEESHAERLLILGDFWHARAGRNRQVLDDLDHWRSRHTALHIDLIRGNHDRAGLPPPSWADRWHPRLLEPPFLFAHHPEPSDDGYVLCGHLHPGYQVTGRGRQKLKVPCFWFGDRVGVLPAFGAFTGLAFVTPAPADRLVLIAGDVLIGKSQ